MMLPMFPLPSVFFTGEVVAPCIFLRSATNNWLLRFGITYDFWYTGIYGRGKLHMGPKWNWNRWLRPTKTGAMDIICIGIRSFKVSAFQQTMEGKLYPAGEVEFISYYNDSVASLRGNVISLVIGTGMILWMFFFRYHHRELWYL